MSLEQVRPDLLKYEVRVVQGQDPRVREQRKPGGFGRFLSGLGKVLGAVALPFSLIFPPAAIVAAASYGAGMGGDMMANRAASKVAEKQARDQATNVVFPGFDSAMGMASGIRPASFGEDDVRQVLESRGRAVSGMNGSI